MRISKPSNLIPPRLHQKAFDNSFLPNIISIISSGKIIAANLAAGKLLGYSGDELLTKNFNDIFIGSNRLFKQMLKQRETVGHAIADLTVIKKKGKKIPCQVMSVIFVGDKQIRKAITTLVDRSENIRRQTEIDRKKEKRMATEIINAQSNSEVTLNRLHNLEHKLDEEITAKEVSLSKSMIQQKLFEKEWKAETKLKAIQIANAITEAKQLERSDLGKELHDNVTQLLAASRLYLDLAKRNKINRDDNLNRSSEYTLTAIEEIRKLAKGLVSNVVNNVGLCNAIHSMMDDLMKAYPIKIICKMDDDLNILMSPRFNLDIFRIVQEQLNNIIKHAKATRVKINLFRKEDDIVLSVIDNGIGFDVAKKVTGIGIINMKSRAASHKGLAEFISKLGKGSALTATFPIKHSNDADL
ncbi:MAG TPA: PAS domain-containing protein [Puia sp.]|jgi:PAS domain S-box-containing protein|nr:PAS domain-containing protein [Puia sp.]